MGYPTTLFLEEVAEEFICSICHDVVEKALMTYPCEHFFCKTCIEVWRGLGGPDGSPNTCPTDRLVIDELKQPPRVYNNLLNRLKLRCPYHKIGCKVVITLEEFAHHKEICDANPENNKECANGCGTVLKKSQIRGHSCIGSLKSKNLELLVRNVELKTMVLELEGELMKAGHAARRNRDQCQKLSHELQKKIVELGNYTRFAQFARSVLNPQVIVKRKPPESPQGQQQQPSPAKKSKLAAYLVKREKAIGSPDSNAGQTVAASASGTSTSRPLAASTSASMGVYPLPIFHPYFIKSETGAGKIYKRSPPSASAPTAPVSQQARGGAYLRQPFFLPFLVKSEKVAGGSSADANRSSASAAATTISIPLVPKVEQQALQQQQSSGNSGASFASGSMGIGIGQPPAIKLNSRFVTPTIALQFNMTNGRQCQSAFASSSSSSGGAGHHRPAIPLLSPFDSKISFAASSLPPELRQLIVRIATEELAQFLRTASTKPYMNSKLISPVKAKITPRLQASHPAPWTLLTFAHPEDAYTGGLGHEHILPRHGPTGLVDLAVDNMLTLIIWKNGNFGL